MATGTPPREAVEAQLTRMLEAKSFRNARGQSKLLRFVVEATLNEIPNSERKIAAALFPHCVDDETKDDVRIACTQLRGRLSKYYSREGETDQVIIVFPPGKLYKVTFSYNHQKSEEFCHIAKNLLQEHYPTGREMSDYLLELVIDNSPSYFPAYMQFAEYKIMQAIYNTEGDKSSDLLNAALSLTDKALGLRPDSWLAHLMHGAVNTCLRNWKLADRSFKQALKLAPAETEGHLFYVAHLFVHGEINEGMALVEKIVSRDPHNRLIKTLAGAYLYAAGEVNAACEFLQFQIADGSSNWLTSLVLACARITPRRYFKGGSSADQGYRWEDFFVLPDDYPSSSDLFDNDGPFDLTTNASMAGALIEGAWQYFQEPDGGTKVNLCSGFYAYCIAKSSNSDAEEVLKVVPENENFQRAIALLALDKVAEAIISLDQAAASKEPLSLWLHLWPIFDPIRHHPAFQELLEKMGLPSNDVIRYAPAF